jgi:hypothetical protein
MPDHENTVLTTISSLAHSGSPLHPEAARAALQWAIGNLLDLESFRAAEASKTPFKRTLEEWLRGSMTPKSPHSVERGAELGGREFDFQQIPSGHCCYKPA